MVSRPWELTRTDQKKLTYIQEHRSKNKVVHICVCSICHWSIFVIEVTAKSKSLTDLENVMMKMRFWCWEVTGKTRAVIIAMLAQRQVNAMNVSGHIKSWEDFVICYGGLKIMRYLLYLVTSGSYAIPMDHQCKYRRVLAINYIIHNKCTWLKVLHMTMTTVIVTIHATIHM